MASNYPGSLDNLATDKQDDTNTATGADMGVSATVGDHATHHNDLADAINKVETELGTNPSGTRHSTVAANLLELNNYVTFARVATNDIDTGVLPATIDGVTMASGDRFLETNGNSVDNEPTASATVGLWEYTSAGAAAVRPADFPAGSAKVPPVIVATEGNVNQYADTSGRGVYIANVSSLNPGTTSHYWTKLYSAGFYRWLNPISRDEIENLIEAAIEDSKMVDRQKLFNRMLGDESVLFSRHSASTAPTLAANGPITGVTTNNNMVDGVLRFYGLLIPEDCTVTGVRWSQTVQGNYTANNNNKVGLYKSDGTNLILIASSTDDGNIWKAAVGPASKAFSSTYLAEAGAYWVACLYNQSVQTTAPQQDCFPNPSTDGMNVIGLGTNEGWNGYMSGQSDLPTSQAWSGITKGSPRVRAFVSLY